MKNVINFLQLNFLPRSVDAGLLVLRLWLGFSMFWLHGRGKLMNFGATAQKFPDPLGIGGQTSLGLAVFGEVVCALLLVLGLFTRFAALSLVITMSVAFFLVMKANLAPGGPNGELAFIYLAGYVVLLITGAGRFSLDAMLNRSSTRSAAGLSVVEAASGQAYRRRAL